MFRLLKLSKTEPADLLTSKLFNEKSFYSAFISDLRHCREEVIIESPYMTIPRVATLTPVLRKLVKKGVKVRVNIRFPGHHDQLLRIQAYQAAKTLRGIGVKVWYYTINIER